MLHRVSNSTTNSKTQRELDTVITTLTTGTHKCPEPCCTVRCTVKHKDRELDTIHFHCNLGNGRQVLTVSWATLYCVAYSTTDGAVGKVPYRNPYIDSELEAVSLGCSQLTTSHVTIGNNSLAREKETTEFTYILHNQQTSKLISAQNR